MQQHEASNRWSPSPSHRSDSPQPVETSDIGLHPVPKLPRPTDNTSSAQNTGPELTPC